MNELTDLTGGVIPIISFEENSIFASSGELFDGGELASLGEVVYTVRVRNQTGDPIVGSSLILVVEKIVEAARGRDVTTSQLEVLGHDGYTEMGKPYFKVPEGSAPDLGPYAESEPITLRIRNPDLLRLFPPSLKVLGVRRTVAQEVKRLEDILIKKGILTQGQTGEPAENSSVSERLQRLEEALIEKGIISSNETQITPKPTPPGSPE